MYDNNESQTATFTGNTVGLVWILFYAGMNGKSKMADIVCMHQSPVIRSLYLWRTRYKKAKLMLIASNIVDWFQSFTCLTWKCYQMGDSQCEQTIIYW